MRPGIKPKSKQVVADDELPERFNSILVGLMCGHLGGPTLVAGAAKLQARRRAWANHGTPGYFREVFPGVAKWFVFAPLSAFNIPSYLHFPRRQALSLVANWAHNAVKMVRDHEPMT
jgi:hypothetical protein